MKKLLVVLIGLFLSISFAKETQSTKTLTYIVSDINIPFWSIMAKGIEDEASHLGYTLQILSAENTNKQELIHTASAIKNRVDGVIISPISSLSCTSVLRLLNQANIPTVISDIGTDKGNYVSYISSNNFEGAYKIGKVLTTTMMLKGYEKGSVGIIAIPQKRINGQKRTAGFMKALDEVGIKGAGIKQQVDFSYDETYRFAKELIIENKELKAIWLQGSNRYQAALDAIQDAGKKDEILLICFDAEPEFLELIPKGILVGAAMQQPYLMGQKAVQMLDAHLHGKIVQQNIELDILAVSSANIQQKLKIIEKNVLGKTNKNR